MGSLVYQVVCSTALLSLGLYHLILTTRNYLKSPHTYSAKLFHPFPIATANHRFRHLQLYLIILSLLVAIAHQLILSAESDPLLKGNTPVHRFTSLQSAALLFLFLLLTLSLLLSDSAPSLLPLPPDLSFVLASAIFLLHFSFSSAIAAVQTSALEAKCDSVSGHVSALAALLCLLLAVHPRLFAADAALAAAICLRGLWALQTGLSLYADAFIPEGCHRLLDVASGVEGSTKCDVEESMFRAIAIMDLAFSVHAMFVVLIVLVTYAVVAKSVGVRRLGSYEALPTNSSPADTNHSHIQMKALAGTQA
ncbi:uncharacterized protein LOC133283988 [Gastrolobium bilobum]|uniref:uncharacterized protein LOC133283988 n=1 Tax=Gastrolobium bilobum TaxID=150636 RepID=UPI002AB26EBE|nr:uncharacterized protein LOC133283988 [Gastrolobium bilobum]